MTCRYLMLFPILEPSSLPVVAVVNCNIPSCMMTCRYLMLFPILGPSSLPVVVAHAVVNCNIPSCMMTCRYLMLFPILRPSSLPVVVAQPEESHANRTASVLKWFWQKQSMVQLVQTKKNKMTCSQENFLRLYVLFLLLVPYLFAIQVGFIKTRDFCPFLLTRYTVFAINKFWAISLVNQHGAIMPC